jgi:hypothetical protein
MDTSRQLYETDAMGWQSGLYDDIRSTFRADIINWIFRTTMANYPEFLRYSWSQVKPIFETKAFAEFTVTYRDVILTSIEEETDGIPTYRRADIEVSPAEFSELRSQLSTFDVVAPRLAMLFEVIDRGLHNEPIGRDPANDRAATAPFPNWLDTGRGTEPTMIRFSDFPDDIATSAAALQQFHGIDRGLPSIYRCLAQWPGYFTRAWDDLEPLMRDTGFGTAVDRANALTADAVDKIPYSPRLAPPDLHDEGFDEKLIDDVASLFREFNSGAIEDVVPAIHLFAATLDADGKRTLK